MNTKVGKSLVLSLEDRNGNNLKTFTTVLIKNEVEDHPDCQYIKSTGKVEGKKYYGFDMV